MKSTHATPAGSGIRLPEGKFMNILSLLRIGWLFALLLILAAAPKAVASTDHPFLHPLFCDHAVLQRGGPVPVWGWSAPGSCVTVTFAGQSRTVVAGPDGKWLVKLKALRASAKPRSLSVTNSTTHESAVINDVLVGDVWLCSGQSNMEMGVGACNATNDIASANFPQIRLLTVPRLIAAAPVETMKCQWFPCSPDTIKNGLWGGFSAAGFFFGRELNRELNVPIGLIHSSWGGTVAEAWTSAEGLAPLGDFNGAIQKLRAEGTKTNPNVTTVLYNAMIAPLLPFAIKGAIWYQGESNAGRAAQYRRLLPAMIGDWRARFGVGDFPFYIVQLAAFQTTNAEPRDNDWAELREAQALTAKNVPHCGLALAIDIGDAKDIHPKNKQEVGRRLALNALAQAYGKKIQCSGPWYRSMKVDGDKIRLKFDHANGGLVAKDGKLTGFAIAGEDHKFVWADAVIVGKTIVVSSPAMAKPLALRYAWDINPVCNLYNQAGLPAVPFRTDDWPMITEKSK